MDRSIYESANQTRRELSAAFAFGRITAVYPEERLCEVKTFFGSGATEDNYIPKCQWINMDANPEGDESSAIPRVNSSGLVFWVDGEPFIFGYFRALDPEGKALAGESPEDITEGDKIISTVGGNKIKILSNGVIEIQSSQTLRTIYFPKDAFLSTLCSNYQFQANGGQVDWQTNDLNQTLNRTEYRADVTRSMIVVEEKGAVDTETVHRVRIGPGVPGVAGVQVPVFEETIKLTGEYDFKILPPLGFSANIKPTGAFTIKAGQAPQFEMTMAETGATKIAINKTAEVEITPLGEITVKNPAATLKITATGEISLEATTKLTVNAKGGIDIMTLGSANLTAIGPVNIKGTLVNINGGAAATDSPLTFPTTLSPFTGAPLTPFSTTVKVSI